MTVSVRGRLTLWYLLVLGTSLILLEVLVYVSVKRSIASMIDSDLDARLTATSDFLEQHIKADPPDELQDEFQEYSASRPGGELLQISDASGAWVFRSASLRRYAIAPLPSEDLDHGKAFRMVAVEQSATLRLLAGEKTINGKLYFIQIATDTSQALSTLNKLRWLLLVLTPLTLTLATAGGYWLSTRALGPVMQMTREARSISSDRLDQRLRVPKTADELHSLAETLNAMLARIESSFKRTTQFTADASHELRTPVTVIRSTAEIALRRPRDEKAYRLALEEILQESERTSRLIDDLLTLARLDSAQPPKLAPVEIRQVVESTVIRVQRWIERKQIAFSLGSGDGDIWVLGEEEALSRLFFILLENAVKYTRPEGSIWVTIGGANDHVTVEVHDSGIGIPADDIPYIFNRFFRVDKARSRDEGGFGLGLAIAKSIAEVHRAELSVQSTEGRGSTFRVVFSSMR
jgi:heavy metal sensor kinase